MNKEAFEQNNFDAIFEQVRSAINQNVQASFGGAKQKRQNNMAVIANQANSRKSLFSSQPAQRLTQFDGSKFIPGVATMIVNSLNRQYKNQQNWDKHMEYINKMNEAAAELEGKMK